MVAVFVGLLTALLALLATQSPTVGVIGVALAAIVATVCVVGADRVGFGCLLAGGFFSPMDNVRPPGGGLFTVGDLFYVLGILLLLPTRITRKTEMPPGFALGAGGLLAMSVLTTIGSASVGDSLITTLRIVFALMLLPLVFALYRPSLLQIDRLAWAYVLGQVFNTAYAVTLGGEGQGRLGGLTQQPNYFGMDGAFGCALALYLATRPGRQHDAQRFWAWSAGVVCLVSVVLSGSRTAILAVVVVAVFYPIVERSLGAAYLLAAVATVLLMTFAFLVAAFGPGSALARLLPGNKSAAYSDEDRSHLFASSWAVFKHHPFFGRGWRADDFFTHNVLLEFAMAVGIVGLTFFLILLWSLIQTVFTGGRLHGLGYMAIAYASMTPTTPSIWDRNIWAALALAVLATRRHVGDAGPDDPDSSTPHSAHPRAHLERHR